MKRLVVLLTVTAMLLSSLAGFGAAEEYKAFVYGDCNMDGNINISDVTAMLQHIAKWDVTVHPLAADVNVDDRVNLKDVTLLLKYIAKWDVPLGAAEAIPPETDPYFPEMDFGGEELKILYYGDTTTDYFDECIWGDDLSTSNMGQSAAGRNRKVEWEYNVKITAEECGPISEAVIRQQAGQCDFDLIYEWGTRTAQAALNGYLYDLHTLDEIQYINLDGSYWYPQTHDSLTVGGNMYSVPSTISSSVYAYCDMIYFNKNMMYDIGEEDIRYPYDYVHDGQWTYEKLLELSVMAEKDVNNDGRFDSTDRFGGISGDDILAGMCDDPYAEKNTDGSYSFVPYTERMVEMFTKYRFITQALASFPVDLPEVSTGIPSYQERETAAMLNSFKEGHSLFMKGNLEMSKELSYMQDDYGILPMPAVEEGYDYSCRADACAPVFAVPVQIANPEIMIAVDFMAFVSENLILPTYIEDTLKTKRMEDSRDYDMLDYIIENIDYRWTDIYMNGTTAPDVRAQMLASGNFASLAKQYGDECAVELQGIVDKITLLG